MIKNYSNNVNKKIMEMVNMTRMTLIKHLMPKCYLVKMLSSKNVSWK